MRFSAATVARYLTLVASLTHFALWFAACSEGASGWQDFGASVWDVPISPIGAAYIYSVPFMWTAAAFWTMKASGASLRSSSVATACTFVVVSIVGPMVCVLGAPVEGLLALMLAGLSVGLRRPADRA